MQLLEQKILEHKEAGLRTLREGNIEDAKYHFLTAAELLFKLAKTSQGELRQVRKERAQKFLGIVRDLDSGKAPIKLKRQEMPVRAADIREDDKAAEWLVAERPKVRFADIAGLEEVKQEIRVRMIYPYTHPKEAERYGVRRGGGILLYGPPGTGKTLLARAVAAEINAAFFNVIPSKIMSKWVGEAEKNVEMLFEKARTYGRAIIFIDEIESLMPKRLTSHSAVMQRVVPQFLAELEGFEERDYDLLFIGATNVPEQLDPAALRPGRFDVKIYVGLPGREARAEIFRLNLKGKFISDDIDYAYLAELTENYSGADIREVCNRASQERFLKVVEGEVQPLPINMEDLKQAIQYVRPSVTPDLIAKLERFREHQFNA